VDCCVVVDGCVVVLVVDGFGCLWMVVDGYGWLCGCLVVFVVDGFVVVLVVDGCLVVFGCIYCGWL
jgi:hypothetical protein